MPRDARGRGFGPQRSYLDALEAHYPMLRGPIRDHVTGQRRPMLRFFAWLPRLFYSRPVFPSMN